MNKYIWLRLKEVEELLTVTLEEGQNFLYGKSVIAQKDGKKIGDQITYFKVLKSENEGKNIEYTQVFDVLEEDVLDDKRN